VGHVRTPCRRLGRALLAAARGFVKQHELPAGRHGRTSGLAGEAAAGMWTHMHASAQRMRAVSTHVRPSQ
jgi:hypothetical protein